MGLTTSMTTTRGVYCGGFYPIFMKITSTPHYAKLIPVSPGVVHVFLESELTIPVLYLQVYPHLNDTVGVPAYNCHHEETNLFSGAEGDLFAPRHLDCLQLWGGHHKTIPHELLYHLHTCKKNMYD